MTYMSVRFALSMGLSWRLVGYAFWVSLSGIPKWRAEIERIFKNDQSRVIAYQICRSNLMGDRTMPAMRRILPIFRSGRSNRATA